MADRGTTVAFDATQTPIGVFEHVMEPTAAFGATVGPVYVVDFTEVDAYAHPMEPTADFGAQFTGLYYGPW